MDEAQRDHSCVVPELHERKLLRENSRRLEPAGLQKIGEARKRIEAGSVDERVGRQHSIGRSGTIWNCAMADLNPHVPIFQPIGAQVAQFDLTQQKETANTVVSPEPWFAQQESDSIF